MRRSAWLSANLVILTVLAVTIAENKTEYNNMWFNISICFNTYLECLKKKEFYILPYSVEQANILLFCHQKKFLSRCMRRSEMRLQLTRCGEIAELVVEKGIEADIFQVQYILHAHRIYTWMCKYHIDSLPGWDKPFCFAEKFKYCVDHLNVNLCHRPCQTYPEAYFHKDMIDAIALRNQKALMPVWEQMQRSPDFIGRTLTIEECYELYINCSIAFPYVILPSDVEQSNIVHFCTQQYLIDFCVSANASVKLDFHACGYLAEQTKNSSFEANMLAFAYRIYRYICEKHGHLLPGWDDPVCFMEKFSYCVIAFNSTLCSMDCQPTAADIVHVLQLNGQTGMSRKRALSKIFFLCILTATISSYFS